MTLPKTPDCNPDAPASFAEPAGSAFNVIGLRGDVKDALALLRDEYVQANMHRMGALGARDVAIAIIALEDALRKLPNDQGER